MRSARFAVVFILGLGQQLIDCPDGFIDSCLNAGFRTLRFDHRDAGLSTKLSDKPVPDIKGLVEANAFGPYDGMPYDLIDMKNDVVGLLKALSIENAHIVGYSMGGVIAHLLAIQNPELVRTLICLQTTSRGPSLPPRSKEVSEATLRLCHRYERTDEAIEAFADYLRKVNGPKYPMRESELNEYARHSIERCYCPEGLGRQLAALYATASHAELLSNIKADTLVIHGTLDTVIPIQHGEDQVRRIPGATAVFLEGVGHVQSNRVARMITPRIIDHLTTYEKGPH
jgi:pimeloyl-ACP methyl ester carboxylesterase